MKLRSKLLISFILATLVLVLTTLFLLRWSFERGAETYMRQQDQEQLATLTEALAETYTATNSWQLFIEQPEQWRLWLANQGMGIWQDGAAAAIKNKTEPPRLGRHFKFYFLLDSQHQPIAGRSRKNSFLIPIMVEQNGAPATVGYLGLPPPPSQLHNFWKGPGAAQQHHLLLMFTLGAVIISVLAAFPLSARWTHRILQLHKHVGKLTQGEYNQRLAIAGDDELTKLAEHLNQLTHTLEHARQQRQQMTADISHELRTPVATLQANIEAMQDGILPLSDASLAQLHEQILRLGNLINDLYQLSLADAGALTYNKSACEPAQLVAQLVYAYQTQFQNDGLSLSIDLDAAAHLQVWGDSQRLQQVFTNLLENSRRYTQAPGKVEVIVTHATDAICVTINDSAPGVDPSLHHRLTDRLFRADSARNRAHGGAGLGLNLCAAIIKAHDGSLAFSNSHLGGLSVSVQLPTIKG